MPMIWKPQFGSQQPSRSFFKYAKGLLPIRPSLIQAGSSLSKRLWERRDGEGVAVSPSRNTIAWVRLLTGPASRAHARKTYDSVVTDVIPDLVPDVLPGLVPDYDQICHQKAKQMFTRKNKNLYHMFSQILLYLSMMIEGVCRKFGRWELQPVHPFPSHCKQ